MKEDKKGTAAAAAEQTAAPAPETEREAPVSKKQSAIAKASFVWTVISMLFAIASGVTLILNHWILAPYSYIMLGFLAGYAVAFVAITIFFIRDVKAGKKQIKNLKKLFGIFKIFTTFVFLVVTAVSMVGVVEAKGLGLWQWIILGAQIAVAGVQLGLKITLLILGAIFKKKGKKYAVRVSTYVNGIRKENGIRTAIQAKMYGTDKAETAPAADKASAAAATQGEELPAPKSGETAESPAKAPSEEQAKPAKAPATAKSKQAVEKIKLSGQKAREYASKAAAAVAKRIEDAENRAAGKSARADEAPAVQEKPAEKAAAKPRAKTSSKPAGSSEKGGGKK